MTRQSQPQFQSSMYHYLHVYVQRPGPVTKPHKRNYNLKKNKKEKVKLMQMFWIPLGCIMCKYSIDARDCGIVGSVPTNKTTICYKHDLQDTQ